jgi:long-subunit fatty acid transport protein
MRSTSQVCFSSSSSFFFYVLNIKSNATHKHKVRDEADPFSSLPKMRQKIKIKKLFCWGGYIRTLLGSSTKWNESYTSNVGNDLILDFIHLVN